MSGSGKEFWAVYPYSADNACDGTSITTVIQDTQIGSEGNFSGNAFPAIAKANLLSLAFWNTCGGIKLSVSRSDIKSVTFKGNNGEVLAGKVKIAFNEERRPVVAEVLDGKTEVTLTAPDGGTFKAGKYYYLTLLPSALDGGFTMTFNTADSKGVVTSDKTRTVKRSIFGVLKNIDSKVIEWETMWVEPESVDLGLSVKWATFNVGATKPEGYGDYFAWGETEPKSSYDWSTYKWCSGSDTSLTSYCTKSSYGTVDNKTVLDLSDDAAHVNWGEYWRMPTDAEWTELCENCAWKWIAQNGVNGWLVTSNTNSNSIFLPAAGRRLGTNLGYAGTYGRYWSSSLNPEKPSQSKRVSFKSDEVKRNNYDRTNGQSVRPVYDDRIHPESITLNKATLSLFVGQTEQLTATVLPDNAADKTVTWLSNKEDVASVDENGNVTAIAIGSATITATTIIGAKTAICTLNVVEQPKLEAVDLGLPSGLKWASWNVGAAAPEDYGDYFAWGETEPKSKYDWSTYKFEVGTDYRGPFSKYVTLSSYGTVDNKTVLDSEDDAARANWGSSWCMPTDAEWVELRENCTLTWTTQNGVNGRLVTGPNGNSIFLPAAGYRMSNLSDAGSCGYYWSSSLYTGYKACYFEFGSNNVKGTSDRARSYGHPVRPVFNDRVYPVVVHPESVALNKAELSLYVGHTEQLTATILPENATDKTVKWSSDKADVASVDENGNVTAIATGTTVIRINTTDGNLSAACEVVMIDNTIETISGTGSQKYNYLGSENTYSVLLKGTATVEDGYDLDKYFYYSADYMTLEALRMSGTKVSATASGQMFQVNVDKLKENTTYYFVACVDLKIKGNVKKQLFGEVKTVTTPEYYLPPYVDFNLPSGVKWGTMNIGATNPTKFGTGYEWGHSGYHDQSDYQTGDILPLDEDVAHKTLGGYWRTPTREEWVELFQNCSCSYSMYHEGGTGLVVSKGGAKIFIPLQDYWSATCCTPYWTSESGGWLAATAYVIQGKSTSYEYYIDKKAVNTNAAITSKCKIRAVYVDR